MTTATPNPRPARAECMARCHREGSADAVGGETSFYELGLKRDNTRRLSGCRRGREVRRSTTAPGCEPFVPRRLLRGVVRKGRQVAICPEVFPAAVLELAEAVCDRLGAARTGVARVGDRCRGGARESLA